MDLDADTKRYIVKNDILIFTIESNGLVNNVSVTGLSRISWTDTKLNDDTFKRVIGKNVLYISNGEVIVKEKELPAKPFTSIKPEAKQTSSNCYMVMDIEAIIHNNEFKPYLVCAYNTKNFISSFATNPLDEADVRPMFSRFISDLIKIVDLKYVYAHNLSKFDGIWLIKYLMIHPAKVSVEPLIQDGLIKCIKFTFNDKKKK